ncbi:MAG: glycosyltransferase family 1 protein [Spirochaetota bacterium]|nr:glycosyltransferase family 1 protein [Spirochaetota bacterium]
MKIGVDAYYLYSRINTGVGNYVHRLFYELSKLDCENEYYLYMPFLKNADLTEDMFSNPNFNLREIKGVFMNNRRLWLQSPSLRKQIKTDGIQLFFGGGEYFPLFLPRKIKVAVTIHDVVFKLFPDTITIGNKLFYNLFFPFFIKKANWFFTGTETSRSELKQYLRIDKEIFVIYNGLDKSKYIPPDDIEKDDYILFVGTLQPRKNLKGLIQAYNIISNKIKERLVIVGASGWKNSSLNTLIGNLPESTLKKIDFKGYVSGDELISLYQRAKIFAAPSLHEGFGLIILEAMSSKTPVMSTRRGSIPEVFGDAVLYADPLSPEDIAQKILNLIHDEAGRESLVRKGLILAEKYSIRNQALGYIYIFKYISINIPMY